MRNSVVVFLVLLTPCVLAKLSCKNEAGHDVDWFVALKANNGGDYFYIDSTTHNGFKLSSHSLEETSGGSIITTTKQLYGSLPKSHGYVVYNDQADDGKSSGSRAHAKGVMIFDSHQGFWMIHSMPKFPNRRDWGYDSLPDTTYAQSFMCVTFGISEFEKISAQLDLMSVQIYDFGMEGVGDKVPSFVSLISGHSHPHDSDHTSKEVTLKSIGGHTFTHFGKSRDFEGNLYENLVAPGLKGHIAVETWMNGDHGNQMKSYHGKPYHVLQITEVAMPDGTSWTETQDHSKWAVALDGKKGCIGDINRQYSQQYRGGGTLCTTHSGLGKSMLEVIGDKDKSLQTSTTTNEKSSYPFMGPLIAGCVGAALVALAVIGVVVRQKNSQELLVPDSYVAMPSKPELVVSKQSIPTGTQWQDEDCV